MSSMADRDPELNAAARETAAPANAPAETSKRSRWRLPLMLLVPLVLIVAGGAWWWLNAGTVSTDNAYVQQDMVSISPEVSGRIAEVLVDENDTVQAGDLLFRIDPEPFRIALASAEAELAAAKVNVESLTAASEGTSVDIAAAREDIRFAADQFERQQALLDRGFTTRTGFESAQHDLQQARERLRNAQAAQRSASAPLGKGGGTTYPAIAAAQARVDEARLNLGRTEIHAPHDGRIAQTDRLQVGQQIVSGVPAVSIVKEGRSWIEANFKETDLARMLPGQPATVEIDAYPGLELTGHVESLGAGTGSEFSLLPAQNATGNWVKVTQRVPIRIALDEASPRPLIAGLSVDVRVDVSGDGESAQSMRSRQPQRPGSSTPQEAPAELASAGHARR